MKRYKSIPVLVLSAAMALPVAAAPARNAITTAQIADAISASGAKVTPQQVSLLAEVVATTANPALKVQSVESWGDRRMMVRLECASSEECLPFLVAVRLNDKAGMQPQLARSGQSSTAVSRDKPGSNAYVLHNGSPVILLLEGNHVHIRLSVVCLENGAVGQTVRVQSSDHLRTYTAEVVDGTVVKGRL
jgi:hypothetical protein